MTTRFRTLLLGLLICCASAPAFADVTVQKTSWRGHDALLVANGTVELVLTTAIGPRIVRYAFVGKDNVLGEAAPDAAPTHTALGDWYSYGGHRMWVGPEVMPRTYAPDNGPVAVSVTGGTVTLTQPTDAAGFEKQMAVTLAPTGTGVTIAHRITYRGSAPIEIAPWALTVMHGGGVVILPSEPYRAHEDELLPTRAMALWGYTDLSDPRWTWGRRFVRLRTDAAMSAPQKIGIANHPGWAAYLRAGTLFVKRVRWVDGAKYPDLGVNTETYTAADFLELETLGPLASVSSGGSVSHEERWSLAENVDIGTSEDTLAAAVLPAVGAGQ